MAVIEWSASTGAVGARKRLGKLLRTSIKDQWNTARCKAELDDFFKTDGGGKWHVYFTDANGDLETIGTPYKDLTGASQHVLKVVIDKPKKNDKKTEVVMPRSLPAGSTAQQEALLGEYFMKRCR